LARPRAPHEVPPAELFEIERFVDGDTIWVRRKGGVEKLRLLSVDTEERLGPGHAGSATKPSTVFGEETALWAEETFKRSAKDGEKAKVGLVFPGGKEQKDVYGRLLCHVLLPDGTDYNLLLVETGHSPYFNKYGDDEICSDVFVAAQKLAREQKLGVWNPATNVANEAGASSAIRPYTQLMPWWDARAAAINAFRALKKEKPDGVFFAEDKRELARAVELDHEIEVFGEVDKQFDETSGDATILFRAIDRDAALRVRIPKAARAAHAALALEKRGEEFRQNYMFVKGRVTRGSRGGFELVSDAPTRWRTGGPEPVVSAAVPASAPAGGATPPPAK
jgi:endonuclease YncB( thermonuclease family)